MSSRLRLYAVALCLPTLLPAPLAHAQTTTAAAAAAQPKKPAATTATKKNASGAADPLAAERRG